MKDIQERVRKALIAKTIVDVEISTNPLTYNELQITTSDETLLFLDKMQLMNGVFLNCIKKMTFVNKLILDFKYKKRT